MHWYRGFIIKLIVLGVVLVCANRGEEAVFALEYTVDFSEQLDGNNIRSKLMLAYTYKPVLTRDYETSGDNAIFLRLHKTGRIDGYIEYKIRLQEGTRQVYWYPHNVGGEIQGATIMAYGELSKEIGVFSYALSVVEDQPECIAGIEVRTASLEDILTWRGAGITMGTGTSIGTCGTVSQDFYLFRWQAYPDVLIFSFKSRDVQEKYLKRLAFFAEKTHTRGSVQALDAIAHRKGWGAHDYKAEDLVEFFNIATAQASNDTKSTRHIVLNEEELLLRDILREAGLMIETDASGKMRINAKGIDEGADVKVRYVVNPAQQLASAGAVVETVAETIADAHESTLSPISYASAIVSYARSDSVALQKTLLYHELLHTYYFRDVFLQEELNKIWQAFGVRSQEIWRAFMAHNGYDPSYDYLMKNELFAYMLQRPIKDLSWYIPARILAESLSNISPADTAQFTADFTRYAKELSSYISHNFRIEDGDTRYINIIE